MDDLVEQFRLSLKACGRAETTESNYVASLERFFIYLKGQDPREVTPNCIRQYQLKLIDEKLSAKTVNLYIAAIRFFYLQTLRVEWPESFVARVKERRKLPIVLSPDEVANLVSAVPEVKSRTLLMTMYSAGLRPTEVVSLRPGNIDSQRMLIHVEIAKGGKNRFVPLSETLLHALRLYWFSTSDWKWVWLFPSDQDDQTPYPKAHIGQVLKAAALTAGLTKPVTPHLIRHCFATHLLELGVDLRVIQLLLGHAVISSTEIYTHLRSDHLPEIKNPLDQIASKIRLR